MKPPTPQLGERVVILSGAGLSAASGVPTFRGAGGWWRGHDATALATPEAFAHDPELVLDFYAHRRRAMQDIRPNPAHHALVRLQAAWGPERVTLVTQNVDGLLQAAAAEQGVAAEIIEMHGTLWAVRCAGDPTHGRPRVTPDAPDPRGDCAECGDRLRPDVVWFGEMPRRMAEIGAALSDCRHFLAVGTSGVVYPAAGFVAVARQAGAACTEVNPEPTGGDFQTVLAGGAEQALPALVEEWLTA